MTRRAVELWGQLSDGSKVPLMVDDDGNLMVVTEAITIENVNVVSPLGVTVDDGADIAQGSVADTPWAGSGDGSINAVLKAMHDNLLVLGILTDPAWDTESDAPIIAILKSVALSGTQQNGDQQAGNAILTTMNDLLTSIDSTMTDIGTALAAQTVLLTTIAANTGA